MKKIILCLLLIAVLTIALIACGSRDNDPDDDPVESTAEVTTTTTENAPEKTPSTEALTEKAPETAATTESAPKEPEESTTEANPFINDNEAQYPSSWN